MNDCPSTFESFGLRKYIYQRKLSTLITGLMIETSRNRPSRRKYQVRNSYPDLLLSSLCPVYNRSLLLKKKKDIDI